MVRNILFTEPSCSIKLTDPKQRYKRTQEQGGTHRKVITLKFKAFSAAYQHITDSMKINS
jgi:hypothetical protein